LCRCRVEAGDAFYGWFVDERARVAPPGLIWLCRDRTDVLVRLGCSSDDKIEGSWCAKLNVCVDEMTIQWAAHMAAAPRLLGCVKVV